MNLTPKSIRRRFLVLRAMRWLPVGLTSPVLVLLMVDRGLSLAQVGLVTAAQAALVLALELPTGGLADAVGRRPVLLGATLADVASLVVFLIADTLMMFLVVFALQGIYRALESGPLDAWYVDAALSADPDANIEGGLSAGGVVVGVAIAAGSLMSGGLVALDPIPETSALALPLLVAMVVRVLELGAIAALMHEGRPVRSLSALRRSVSDVPAVLRESIRLVRGSKVLLALVSVELFWGFGMTSYETLMPPKLAETAGDTEKAAALLGPTVSAAWAVSAVGAALVPLLTRQWGTAMTGALLRIIQGATVITMGLVGGVIGVVAAFLAVYMVHGASNPVHKALLHRQVTAANRTTVLSLNSMMALSASGAGGIVLGWLADAASVSTAIAVGGAVLALAAPLYLPARRA